MIDTMRESENSRKGLKNLIEFIELENITMIEIGSYSGQSAEIFASSNKIKSIYCIDPWENGYDNTDRGSYQYSMEDVERDFDKRLEKYQEKITKVKKKSEEAFSMFDKNSIDLVYIDGNHGREYVSKDLELYFPLIKSSGYISGHDWHSKEVYEPVIEFMGRKPDKVFIDRSWIYKI